MGDMVKVSFLPDEISVVDAVQSRGEDTFCGSCPFRPADDEPCYVVVGWRSQGGLQKTSDVPPDLERCVEAVRWADKPLRLGPHPSRAPLSVSKELVEASRDEQGRPRHTGFIHDWDSADLRWRDLVMASVDSPQERRFAKLMGFRTFRTKLPGQAVEPGEILCPATPEGGSRTDCASCLLCSGRLGRGSVDIVVNRHDSEHTLAQGRRVRREFLRPQLREATRLKEAA